MPLATPQKILAKYRKLHTRLKGAGKVVKFVRFGMTGGSFASTHVADQLTDLAYPPIVKDKPGDELLAYFNGGIGPDQKIFIFVAHSFVDAKPYDTLDARAEQFIIERFGQENGGLYLGDQLFIFDDYFPKVTLGGISPQWIILATGIRRSPLPYQV